MNAASSWTLWTTSKGPLSRLLRRYRWSIPVIIAGGILTSGLEGIGIALLAPLLAGLNGSAPPAAMSGLLSRLLAVGGQVGERNHNYELIVAIICVMILKATVQGSNASFAAWIDTRIGHSLHSALSARLLTTDYTFFLNHDPGRLVTIIATDSWRVTDAVRLSFSALTALTALLVFAVLMGVISFPLLAGVAVGTTIVRLLQQKLVRRLHSLSKRLTATNAELANRMLLSIEAMRLIRIFGQEQREHQRFCAASETVRRVLFESERLTALVTPALEVAQTLLFTAVLIAAAALGIELSTVLAFLLLLYRAEPHLRTLSHARLSLASLRSPISEVEWLLSITGQEPLGKAPEGVTSFTGQIRFEQVTYCYPTRVGQPPALHELSFVLRDGKSTALIGRSGAGKSTVIHLLCRLLVPTSGSIKVGNTDLSEIDVRAWRKAIGIAGQDLDLIAGTVAENISYGMPEASQADITWAAEISDAADFIHTLPDGYNTTVGVKGLSLSGGQRQRIGIARAIIRRPRLLILDEATNAVDGASESAIVSLLQKNLPDVTTIVISHHAAALSAYDDVIRLEGGRATGEGPASAPWVREQLAAGSTTQDVFGGDTSELSVTTRPTPA